MVWVAGGNPAAEEPVSGFRRPELLKPSRRIIGWSDSRTRRIRLGLGTTPETGPIKASKQANKQNQTESHVDNKSN